MLTRHPLSALWGDLPDDEFAALVEDIRQRGLIEPILTYQDQILDGWHRYRACQAAGQPLRAPMILEYNQARRGDPASYVIARNAVRRHLTASQRAAAVVAAFQWQSHGGDRRCEAGASGTSTACSAAELAAKAGVGESTIRHAKTAERAGLGDRVRSGELSAKAAAQAGGRAKKPPPPTKVERLEAALGEAQRDAAAQAERMEALEEQLQFWADQDRPHDAARWATLNSQREQIRALKADCFHWKSYAQRLRQQLKALGADTDRG